MSALAPTVLTKEPSPVPSGGAEGRRRVKGRALHVPTNTLAPVGPVHNDCGDEDALGSGP